ncbi:uncharacterized protein LOC106011184 [Aplysia californica]|uniref:Uncharacterized protein LOC106011184 n=1 Tax=Aplysia californica TaxID=6500 RepID=A0ABM0ZVH7_APLCA|nr:uncharacterized protein LOC106011184 [Aplysia californica]
MLRTIAVLALGLGLAFAAQGDNCVREDQCGKGECCMRVTPSRRALNLDGIPGFCQKLSAEGESCNSFSSCNCQKGLKCQLVKDSDTPFSQMGTCQRPVVVKRKAATTCTSNSDCGKDQCCYFNLAVSKRQDFNLPIFKGTCRVKSACEQRFDINPHIIY